MDDSQSIMVDTTVPEPLVVEWETPTPEEIEAHTSGEDDTPLEYEILRPSGAEVEPDGVDLRIFEASAIGGPATYTYDAWWSGPAGSVWLKAFDVDGNAVSLDRDRTEMAVNESADLERFEFERSFNIHTEPKKPIPIRFELWFQPNDGGDEQLATGEDTYEIIGWYR